MRQLALISVAAGAKPPAVWRSPQPPAHASSPQPQPAPSGLGAV